MSGFPTLRSLIEFTLCVPTVYDALAEHARYIDLMSLARAVPATHCLLPSFKTIVRNVLTVLGMEVRLVDAMVRDETWFTGLFVLQCLYSTTTKAFIWYRQEETTENGEVKYIKVLAKQFVGIYNVDKYSPNIRYLFRKPEKKPVIPEYITYLDLAGGDITESKYDGRLIVPYPKRVLRMKTSEPETICMCDHEYECKHDSYIDLYSDNGITVKNEFYYACKMMAKGSIKYEDLGSLSNAIKIVKKAKSVHVNGLLAYIELVKCYDVCITENWPVKIVKAIAQYDIPKDNTIIVQLISKLEALPTLQLFHSHGAWIDDKIIKTITDYKALINAYSTCDCGNPGVFDRVECKVCFSSVEKNKCSQCIHICDACKEEKSHDPYDMRGDIRPLKASIDVGYDEKLQAEYDDVEERNVTRSQLDSELDLMQASIKNYWYAKEIGEIECECDIGWEGYCLCREHCRKHKDCKCNCHKPACELCPRMKCPNYEGSCCVTGQDCDCDCHD